MIKFLSELGPLFAFFIGYKYAGIQVATIAMVAVSIISLTIFFIVYRKVEKVTLISSLILLFSASITLLTGNPIFIKMKPTILYLLFAAVILWGFKSKRPVLKYVLQGVLKLKDDKYWDILGLRFVVLFICFAILNEVVWRNCEESTWVSFKVFGMAPLTLIFIMFQVPFLLKHKIDEDNKE